jgi:PAS domain S-box-containing protein
MKLRPLSVLEETELISDEAVVSGDVIDFAEYRKRMRSRLEQNERHFQDLLNALPGAVYTTDRNGYITYYNQAAAELWGQRPQPGESRWCGSWKLQWPDGTPLPHEECPMALALAQQHAIRGVEAVAERPDGSRVPMIAYPTPLRDEAGRPIGAVNMLLDITERKRFEQEQALLIRELHNRVRNTLASVLSIMNSSAKFARGMEDFERKFAARLEALSQTYSLLTEDRLQRVSFAAILKSELAAFDDGQRHSILLEGPEVYLGPTVAVPLAIGIHELATNAAKYGAFSRKGGEVRVRWGMADQSLWFEWQEANGPEVVISGRTGFGMNLLERMLKLQIGADITVRFYPEGLYLLGVVPLDGID